MIFPFFLSHFKNLDTCSEFRVWWKKKWWKYFCKFYVSSNTILFYNEAIITFFVWRHLSAFSKNYLKEDRAKTNLLLFFCIRPYRVLKSNVCHRCFQSVNGQDIWSSALLILLPKDMYSLSHKNCHTYQIKLSY